MDRVATTHDLELWSLSRSDARAYIADEPLPPLGHVQPDATYGYGPSYHFNIPSVTLMASGDAKAALLLVRAADQRQVGHLHFDGTVQTWVSIEIGAPFRGNGFARQGLTSAVRWFCSASAVDHIQAEVVLPNESSSRMLAASGFVRISQRKTVEYWKWECASAISHV